jgi:FKBP-type peptidyl-prolyl cis-trans isomerase FkpA
MTTKHALLLLGAASLTGCAGGLLESADEGRRDSTAMKPLGPRNDGIGRNTPDDAANAKRRPSIIQSEMRGVQPIMVEHLRTGSGDPPSAGQVVTVSYVGTLTNGKKFDSGSISFKLGAGNVIRGWDMVVAQMHQGDTWRVTIPSELAYGRRGAGGGVIPPDADLVFEMELNGVKD